jgi:hypothetical protein
MSDAVDRRLAELGIALPEAPEPLGAYRAGNRKEATCRRRPP